ncbi:MAG: hypothetical protein K2X82_18755 [Gemmataceae bacterium]|nr:hypothetical protein [Gemmataceae bacterium]
MPVVVAYMGGPGVVLAPLVLAFVVLFVVFASVVLLVDLVGTRGRGRVLPRVGPLPRAAGPMAVVLAVGLWASGALDPIPGWVVPLLTPFVVLWAMLWRPAAGRRS